MPERLLLETLMSVHFMIGKMPRLICVVDADPQLELACCT